MIRQFQAARVFLRGKIAHLSPGDIVYSQVEALLGWLAGSIPGVPGFALRTAVYKLLFRRLDGFAWIQPGVTFVQTDRISVGRNFGVNTGSYLNGIGGLTIGDYVLIGSNVTISSGQHAVEGREPPVFARPSIPKPIAIENDVWIGAGVVIVPGVTLRQGTVVGANAVVTKDTVPYGIYAGVPARLLRLRDEARGTRPGEPTPPA